MKPGMREIGYTSSVLFLNPDKALDKKELTLLNVSDRVWKTLDELPSGAFVEPNMPEIINAVEALEEILAEKHSLLMGALSDSPSKKELEELEAQISEERRMSLLKKWTKEAA